MASDTNQTHPDGKPRLRLWVRILLFLSLAMNLLVIGLVIGAIATGGPRFGPPDRRDPVAPYTRALTEDQRDSLRAAVRQNLFGDRTVREARRAARRDMAAGYSEAARLLQADPFDPDALAQVLRRQGSLAREWQAVGQGALLELFGRMTVEERAAYAARLAEEARKLPKRRARKGGED